MRVRIIGWSLLVGLLLPWAGFGQVFKTDDFRLNLYFSSEFEYQFESEGLGDPNGSFDLDQVDIAFTYNHENFRFVTDLVIEHGVSTEDDRGNIALSFGFVEYRHSDQFRFRVGKFLTPYGIQNEFNIVRSSFITVKNPNSVYKPDKLTSSGFRFAPRRQVGVSLLGAFDLGGGLLQYDVLIGNGEQEDSNPFEEDNNSEKSLTTRVSFEPDAVPNLSLGITTYLDTLSASGDEDVDLRSLGLSLDYEGLQWTFRSEVFSGEVDRQFGGTTDQTGVYADIGYRFGRLTPYIEGQWVETKGQGLSESAYAVNVGIYYQIRDFAVLKVENGYQKGDSGNLEFADIPGQDYNELRAAFVVGF